MNTVLITSGWQALPWELFAQSTLLLMVAGLIVLFLRRASAALRHLIWCSATMAVLLLPLGSWVLPNWRVAVLPIGSRQPVEAVTVETSISREATVERSRNTTPASFSERDWLLGIWQAGIALAVIPLLAGWWQLGRLLRRSKAAAPELLAALHALQEQTGVSRRVRLLICPSVRVPVTCGAARPIIMLPSDCGDWPAARLRVVLLHELAHIKRLDWFSQALADLACAIHWFNPLAWIAVRRMRVERELACDDAVLRAGASPVDYADELLRFASKVQQVPLLNWAAVPMARPSRLEERITVILNERQNRTALSRRIIAATTAVGVLTFAGVAMLRAEPATDARTLVFDTTFEREITDSDNSLSRGSMINLATGRVYTGSEFSGPADTPFLLHVEELLKWLRARGVDLMGDTSGKSFSGVDMLIVPTGEAFDQITVEALATDKRLDPPVQTQVNVTVQNVPQSFLVKTREGRRGVLEVTDFTRGLEKMRFRYKLLRPRREFNQRRLILPADTERRFVSLDDAQVMSSRPAESPVAYLEVRPDGSRWLIVDGAHNYSTEPVRGAGLWKSLSAEEVAEPAGLAGLPFERQGFYELAPQKLPVTILVPQYGMLQVSEVSESSVRLVYKQVK